MKENNKLVVFYNAEKDAFIEGYKDRDTLAFETVLTTELRNALSMSLESYEEQKTELDKLAEAFGCEVLNVEVEYNVTKLDGSDFERTEREPSLEDGLKTLMELFAKNN